MAPQNSGPLITRNIGFLLLGIWMILYGVFALVHVEASGIILAILAIFTGIFILIGR